MKRTMLAILMLLILAAGVVGLGRLVQQRAAKRATEQFYLGESFLEKKDDDGARQAFLSLIERSRRSEHVEPALARLGEISERDGQFDTALGYWQRLLDEFLETARRAEATYHVGYCLEKVNRYEEAFQKYELAPEGSPFHVLSVCGMGRMEESTTTPNLLGARDMYRRALAAATVGTPEYKEAAGLIGALNVRLLFSRATTPESMLYTIRSGDTVSGLGTRFNVSKASITRANSLDSNTPLRLNRTLKITPHEYRIVVDKSDFALRLFADDHLFKEYTCRVGRPEFPTTPGKYVIQNKMTDPVWYSPEGKVFPGGDPGNELGTRWMGLRPLEPDLPTDLGIHATIQPDTIGKASSRGCPGMLTADAEELFDIIPLRTPVLIQD